MWVFTFIWYQHKNIKIDAGSIIILTYIVYAAFSIMSINDTIFSAAYNKLKLFPYIYLYIMMMIALSPAIYDHQHPSVSIDDPNTRILKYLSIIILICAILRVPEIISNSTNGIMKLFTDADAGKNAYLEQTADAGDSGTVIRNIPAIIYNSLSDITVFLCFYFMTRKKSFWIVCSLLFCTIIGIVIPITIGQRSGVVSGILTAIGGYMLFRSYISKKINKIIQKTGIICIVIMTLPIAAITISRFGKEAAGVGGFVNWYVGQGSLYFNNYGLDAGGTRHGDRTCNYFKRLIDPDTPRNYEERRDKYHNLKIDDYFFPTFVGDFTIDFGPVVPVFIFIIFNFFVIKNIRPRDGTIALHQLLLIFFTLCVSLQGGMTLFSYSDSGNLRIVTMALLYAYLRYHEVLLKKFPLKTNSKINNNEGKNNSKLSTTVSSDS